MPTKGGSRKHPVPYHHGNLEAALLTHALRIIQEDGVAALTLRRVGDEAGVSRTALYRHFEDKAALLARVALEGFRMFRASLENALVVSRQSGSDPLEEMAGAYLRHAVQNPAHYRVMFGRDFDQWERYPALVEEAGKAFQVLLGTVEAGQKSHSIKPGNPLHLALTLWSMTHGMAMLAIDGQLSFHEIHDSDIPALARSAAENMIQGIKRQPKSFDSGAA